jgi:protein tyrosine phosphatase (PTP) superfamily phosphohydrolase (DUF442 family)
MESNNTKIRAFVCGHTGATGKALMDILVESPDVESIVAVGRRENEKYKNHPKVKQYIVSNMIEIGKEDISIAEGCNAAFCTIGTPFNDVFKKSKKDDYRMVDFGIATEFAKFAKKAGVTYFATITGEGTDGNSKMNMYVVKKDVENLIQSLGFERIAIMRPGFLDRGKDATWQEKIMLPKLWGTPVAKVAGAMIWGAINQTEKVKGYSTKEIRAKAQELGV